MCFLVLTSLLCCYITSHSIVKHLSGNNLIVRSLIFSVNHFKSTTSTQQTMRKAKSSIVHTSSGATKAGQAFDHSHLSSQYLIIKFRWIQKLITASLLSIEMLQHFIVYINLRVHAWLLYVLRFLYIFFSVSSCALVNITYAVMHPYIYMSGNSNACMDTPFCAQLHVLFL
jgi:hypothetical protein